MLEKFKAFFPFRDMVHITLLAWVPIIIIGLLDYFDVVEAAYSGGAIVCGYLIRYLFCARTFLRRLLFLLAIGSAASISLILALLIGDAVIAFAIALLHTILQAPLIIWLQNITKGYFDF